MLYKCIFLKGGRGLALHLTMTQQHMIGDPDDAEINDSVFLRIRDTGFIDKKTVVKWAFSAMQDIEDVLQPLINSGPIVFTIESMETNMTCYQDEIVYYAIRNWIYSYNNLSVPDVDFYYDKKTRRFIFPVSENSSKPPQKKKKLWEKIFRR